MASKKDQILTLLPNCSKKDLAAVIGVAESLLGTSEGSTETELWFNAINSALGQNKKLSFMLKSLGNKFKTHAVMSEEFLNSLAPLGMVEKVAARKDLIELLIADLKQQKVVPTIGSIAANLGRLADVFDGPSGYPGYRDSGLAHLVFNRRGEEQ